MSQSGYQYHVFFCTNDRPGDDHCCARKGAVPLWGYAKQRVKELGLEGVRINAAGCLDRCHQGPALVIYPQGVWYSYASQEDIDEIIDRHLVKGERVDRLLCGVD